MIAVVALGAIRQLAPAGADVDAGLLEAPEERDGIGDVEVFVRGLTADLAVVNLEHPVIALEIQLKQRLMPPEMQREVAAALPLIRQRRDPRQAIAESSLHLRDVRDRVRRPDIATVELNRLASHLVGLRILACFFQAVGVAAEDIAIAWHRCVPGWERSCYGIAHALALTEVGEHELRYAQGDEISREFREQDIPMLRRLPHLTSCPGV